MAVATVGGSLTDGAVERQGVKVLRILAGAMFSRRQLSGG